MNLKDKMKRNIEQIENAEKCPRTYFLDKTKSECIELKDECDNLINNKLMFGHYGNKDNFHGEIAGVLNCIIYLILLFGLDIFKIIRIMFQKVDRGYERGVE